jgi:hypothetical protein
VQYALSGEGLVLADPQLFQEEVRSGRLVKPFDIALEEGYGYYLTTHPEDLNNEAVALFRSWLIARFSAQTAEAAAAPIAPSSPSAPPASEASEAERPKLRAAK